MKRLGVYIAYGAGLATIAMAVVAVMPYLETRAPTPVGSVESPANAPRLVDEIATLPPRESSPPLDSRLPDEILVGHSVEDLRKRNNVRQMMELEDDQKLSETSGVFGFLYGLFLRGAFGLRWLHDFDPPLNRSRSDGDIEVHKTASGKTMLLLYVDEGSVARLAGVDDVGDIFAFFSPHGAHNHLVAVPISRIANWDHRVSDPQFAKVRVD